MLLISPKMLANALSESKNGLDTREGVEFIASRLGVGVSALIEHAYNMNLIDDATREELRLAFDRP